MKNNKDDLFITIFILTLTTIFLYQYYQRKERRKLKVNNIKSNLNKGFLIDIENLNQDYKQISNDIYQSYENERKKVANETL